MTHSRSAKLILRNLCVRGRDLAFRHRQFAAAGVGALVPLASVFVDVAIGPVAKIVSLVVLVSLCFLVLLLLCIPLTRYGRAFALSLSCGAGIAITGGLCVALRVPLPSSMTVPTFMMITIQVLLVYALLLFAGLSVGVFIRRRYWPVYPEGRCSFCGYDLQGLPAARCPECGTFFVRMENDNDGTQQTG